MLLNEFLKEHPKVQNRRTVAKQEIADLKTTVAQQQKQIEALTATVRKVSERVELSSTHSANSSERGLRFTKNPSFASMRSEWKTIHR